jgi:AraC-like DNA-binding protein
MRLLKARRLLEQTDACVMTVAQACGYSRLGVFSAQFKKRTGLTPSEFRQQSAGNCSPVALTTPSSAVKDDGAAPPPPPLVTEK